MTPPASGATVALLAPPIPDHAPPDELDGRIQAQAVTAALTALGHPVQPVAFSLDLAGVQRQLAAVAPDLVFNLVESVAGQDRLLPLAPLLLEALGLPFTGCGSTAQAMTGSKLVAKRLLTQAGLPTPEWHTAADLEQPATTLAAPSFIIKSVWEHASQGLDQGAVRATRDAAALAAALRDRRRQLPGELFAEAFIPGREINLALLEDEAGCVQVLPAAEILFQDLPPGHWPIVDYAAKWHPDSWEYRATPRTLVTAASDRPLVAELAGLARAAWQLFGLAGYARVDFRVDPQGRPFILEVNANPCLAPDAGFAAAAGQAGLSYATLVGRIVAAALRPGRGGEP
ncbi:MAG: D-alanine--D-alanine ligase [Thermodesulfobacteriota bacterium]